MKKKKQELEDFDLGLGGIFRGIGSLLGMLEEMAEKGETEIKREGEFGKGFKAVYGFSVKYAGTGRPTVEPFGNIREDKDKGPVVDEVREPLVDVFDEEKAVIIVAELPGIDEKDIHYEVKDDIVTISAATGEKKYHKELLLSTSVDEKSASLSYHNGILELKLWKKP
jgi:HSP20 family protein